MDLDVSSDKLAELEAALKKQAGGAAALIELAWHLPQRDRHRALSVCCEVAALFCQLDEAEALLSAKLLSPKEREILQLLACNDANKEIANALEVGDETIKWHLKKIHTKREAGSRKHAVTRGNARPHAWGDRFQLLRNKTFCVVA